MKNICVPKEPVKTALIGAGSRASRAYGPLFDVLTPWIDVVAVCDPVKEHCDALAQSLGGKGYYDIHELVKDKPMEAALIVVPIPAHHSISVYLSSHGIHNQSETTWCSMVAQARDMIETARKNNVIVRVGENFFRVPIDRFAQTVRDSGYLGPIKRIFSYNDHTGYHNNSRWIAFAECHPTWVQSISHTMDTISFYSSPQRFHQTETFRARYFNFPNDLIVIDQAANLKGFLGRHRRPGYTEWQGERGILMHDPTYQSEEATGTELRYCSDKMVHREDIEPDRRRGGGRADEISQVKTESDEQGCWIRSFCETSDGLIEYVNDLRLKGGIPVMNHIIDFALAVRGLRESEFDEEDALMSLVMEIGAIESAMNEGKRVPLSRDADFETDAIIREDLKKEFGVDALDVEGMLAISHPKP